MKFDSPTPTELRRISAVALELVNAARVELGHTVVDKWLPGVRACSYECPVSRLLGVSLLQSEQPLVSEAVISFPRREDAEMVAAAWGRSVADCGAGSFQVVTPIVIRNFIHYFDQSRYPDLIKKGSYRAETSQVGISQSEEGRLAPAAGASPLTERLREAVGT